MPLIHFLLAYDRQRQELVYQHQYSNAAEALAAYEAMEEKHRDDRHVEIVLIGADSIKTVMLTHGNYFGDERAGQPTASPYLAGV